MESSHILSDSELLLKIIAGDENSFAMLYDRYKKNIYNYVHRYVHSAEMADDLTQEVFIKIWNSRKKLGHVKSLRGYLLVTARNHTIDNLKAALINKNAIGEVVRNLISRRVFADDNIIEKDYAAFLQGELAKLPDRTREVFRLCRDEGLSYEQVAQELKISKNAVKNHMVFSIKILKTAVDKELGISLVVFFAALLSP